MTTTSILALPLLAPNQSQKEVTINDALSALERAISDRLSVPLTADYTVDIGDSTRYAIFVTTGNTSTHVLTFPASKRFFFVKNGGTASVTVAVTGVATTFSVPVNSTCMFYSDETTLSLLLDTVQTGATPTSFLLLGDTPDSYAGKAGKAIIVKGTEDGLDFTAVATSFLTLADTPSNYSGAAGKFVKVNGAANALEFVSGVSSFLTLSDAPTTYAAKGGKIVAVKGTENGLEFIDIPSLSAQKTVNALLTTFDDIIGWTQTSGTWSVQSSFGSVSPSSYNDTFLVCDTNTAAAGVSNMIERTIDLTSVVTAAELDTECDLKVEILEASSYNDYGFVTITFLSGSGTTLSTATTGNFTAYPDPSWIARTLSAPIPVGARQVKISLGAVNIDDSTNVTHAYARIRVDVLVPLSSISTFLDLQDVPDAYIADARVRVNSAGTGIEFVADTLINLKDIPTPSANKVLKRNPANDAFVWGDASVVGAIGDLSDVPDTKVANKILRVNSDASALVYVDPTIKIGDSSAQADASVLEFSAAFAVTVGVGGIASVDLANAVAGTLEVKEGAAGTALTTETLVFDPTAFTVSDLGGSATQISSKQNTTTVIYESTADGNMDLTKFAGYSFGSPVVVKYVDGSVGISGTHATNDHVHGIARAAPITDFDVIARVSPESGHDDVGFGLALVESSGIITTAVLNSKTGLIRAASQTWTDPTTSSTQNFDVAVSPKTSWVKLSYAVATNVLTVFTSVNGQDWQQIGTVTLTTDPQWVGFATSAPAAVKASMRGNFYADPTYTADAIQIGGGNLVGARRFWRFAFEETQNGGAAALSGLALHSTVGGAIQVPTSSSESSFAAAGNEATRLYDSDTATAWIAGAAGYQWVDFDFGTSGAVCVELAATSMNNANFNQAPKSAQVFISDDGEFYQFVGEVVFGTWLQNETKTVNLPSRLVASSYATDDVDTAANLAAKQALLAAAINGGSTGQVLTKASGANGDVTWTTPAAGGGGGSLSLDTAHAYWRVLVTDSFSASYVNFYELAFASSGMGADLTETVGGTAIAGVDTAANAFDNSTSTSWVATAANIAAGTAWVGFHFNSAVSVKEMRFQAAYTYGEMVKSWKLQYSDDGTTWTDAQSYTDTTPWGNGMWRAYGVTVPLASVDMFDDVDVSSVPPDNNQILVYDKSKRDFVPGTVFGGVSTTNNAHRWWRIRVADGHSTSWVTLGELKFCTTSGGANLATGGIGISGKGDAEPVALFDGDPTVRYGIEYSYIATNQCWFGYCFPTPVDVKFVGLGSSAWTGEMPTVWALEYSDDGVTWFLAQNDTDLGNWTASEYRYYPVTAFDKVVSVGDLADVDLTVPPTSGQALLWNSGTKKFAPGTVSSGGSSGSTASYRGDWGILADPITVTFDTNELPADWTYYSQKGTAATFVADADSVVGNTLAFQFGDIDDNQQVYVQFTATANSSNNTLKIRYRGESEGGFDKLHVLVDNVEVFVVGGSGVGASYWTEWTTTLTNGTHTIKIVYTKDGSGTTGWDSFRFSEIAYPKASATGYQYGDTVLHNGQKWFCALAGTATTPGASQDWLLLVPAGGTSGQVLAKTSPTDYAVGWVDAASGGSGAVPVVGVLDKDRFAPPYSTDFPTVIGTNSVNPNVGYSTTAGLTLGFGVSPANSDNVRAAVKSLPGTASWTVVTRMRVNHRALNYSTGGLVLRNSSTGKILLFGYDTITPDITVWNNPTTCGSTPWKMDDRLPPVPWEWWKIDCDGTNLKFYSSIDGTTWVLLYTTAITAVFTSAPDQVGFGLHLYHSSATWNSPTTGDEMVLNVLYYNDNILPATSRVLGVNGVNTGSVAHDYWSPVINVPRLIDLPVTLTSAAITDSSTNEANCLLLAGTAASAASWAASGDGMMRLKAFAPGATFEVIAQVTPPNTSGRYDFNGIVLRDEANNKSLMFGISSYGNANNLLAVRTRLAGLAQSADNSYQAGYSRGPIWLRAVGTGDGNVTFSVSENGLIWYPQVTESLTAYITSITHVGVGYSTRLGSTSNNEARRGFPIHYFHARTAVGNGLSGMPTVGFGADYTKGPALLSLFAGSTFVSSEVLFKQAIAKAIFFQSGLPGSVATLDNATTGALTITIKKNGVAVGTINFAAGASTGTFTFASDTVFGVGDSLSIVAPSSADATAAGLALTLVGSY